MVDDIFESVEKVSQIVNDAVSSRDFSKMTEQINAAFKSYQKKHGTYTQRTSERTFGPGGTINRTEKTSQRVTETTKTYGQTQKKRMNKEADKGPVYFKEPSNAGGMTLFTVGLVFTIIFGLGMIPMFIVPFLRTVGIVMGVLALGSLGMMLGGIFSCGKSKRFDTYKELLDKNKYADIEDLAKLVGRSEAKTLEEIKAMLKEGCFPEGHLDKTEKTLMVTDEMYRQYQNQEAQRDILKAQQAAEDAEFAGLSPEVKAMVIKGRTYVRQIRDNNEAIPDPVITEKLNRMEKVVAKIFEEVKEKPELSTRLNMLMEYYLPTTDKLLKAYRDMDNQSIQLDNITTAKAEIAGSLDTINNAFESLLDSFYEEDAMDISTDISVMKTIMRQQGLTEGELKAESVKNVESRMENGPTLAALQQEIKEMDKVH